MTILDKIDKLRLERGWSVNNLAMEAGLTQSTLNNLYIRGGEPKISTLRSICAAFGLTLSEFFQDGFADGDVPDDNAKISELISSLTAAQKKAVIALLRSIN